jgi:ribosomal protein S18 acetylase RimI-like enzyme
MWTTRAATHEDLLALRELCTASVGPDDYVPGFLERFVRDSVTLVAADGPLLVGMMVYDEPPDGSAWLHAARTHPEYRRRGVATALMSSCEAVARRRHRTAMRLWASADNVPSVTANRGYGFCERARFSRMRALAARGGAPPSLERLRLDASAWASIRRSEVLRRSAGFLFHDFYFLRLDRTNALRLSRRQALWRLGPLGFSLSADLEGRQGVQIQPLFGDLVGLLRAAPTLAAALGAERVESFLPHAEAVLATARESGFRPMEWGQEAILFEKPLSRSSPGRGSRRPSRSVSAPRSASPRARRGSAQPTSQGPPK